jgi:hypothetical protein
MSKRTARKILVAKPERKIKVRSLRCKWEDVRMECKETGFEIV